MPPGLAAVLREFALGGEPVRAVAWPGGHIHESWRVTCPGGEYLAQRLNERVFSDVAAVMDNVQRVTAHIAGQLRSQGKSDWERRVLRLVPTRRGASWLRDGAGAAWRVFHFIPGAVSRLRPSSPCDAREAAAAFGRFARLLSPWPGVALADTIPGFHDTAARFGQLEDAARRDPVGRTAGVRAELDACLAERRLGAVLPPLIASGAIPVRVCHNDAKLANVLLDERTGSATCVIDLDTVMPGTLLYDFGDLVRSLSSPAAEDATDLATVVVQPDYFAAIVEGWMESLGGTMTAAEVDHLVFAGRLITMEQAVRFLTDYIEGDVYFQTSREGHNLDRARNQMVLYRSLTETEPALRDTVHRSAQLSPPAL